MNKRFSHYRYIFGAPAVIGREGIRQIIEIPLADSEQEKMDLSAKTLKSILHDAFEKLEAENN